MMSLLLAALTVYPAPDGETLSTAYKVQVAGRDVPVYTQRTMDPPFAGKYDFGGTYHFAYFDADEPVTVAIVATQSLAKAVVFPDRVKSRREGDRFLLDLPGPAKVIVEPDGKKSPLLLFVNPVEKNPPPKDAIVFGPGIHKPEKVISVGSGQTLYLAGGAIVKGAVHAEGTNIVIRGRGILCGNDWEWRKGPASVTMRLTGDRIIVEDIIIRGSPHWTIVPTAAANVAIRNVKICNSRVQNDDGINPCNSREVLIEDCLIRSDDDCIAMKGLQRWRPVSPNVEDITIRDCIFWCDRARVFLLGHESQADFMRRIRVSNIQVPHFASVPFVLEPGEEMRLEDVTLENIALRGEGQGGLMTLHPTTNRYMKVLAPGHIAGVAFRNITVTGNPRGKYATTIYGFDAAHSVSNVVLQNVRLPGGVLTSNHPSVKVGPFAPDIQIKP